jgi:hypothetical protein
MTTDRSPGLTLQEWLDLTGTSYAAFSRQVPCSISYPRKLAVGLARPSYEMAKRIERLTSGAVSRVLWYPPDDESLEDQEEPTEIEDLR